MKRIDVHSHVIPETIVKAMRENPDLYRTRIEGEGDKRVFVRGHVRFVHGHKVRPDTAAVTRTDPLKMFRRFYFDALTHSPQAVRHLIEVAGAERVMLGTDAPFDMGEEHPVDRLEATPGLTAAEREAIGGGNAAKLFGLKA